MALSSPGQVMAHRTTMSHRVPQKDSHSFLPDLLSVLRSCLAGPLQYLLGFFPDVLLAIPAVRSFAMLILAPRCQATLSRATFPIAKNPYSFDTLKYPTSPAALETLVHAAVHALAWRKDTHERHTAALPSLGRVLLSAPGGSRLYLESVASALAKHVGATLVRVDALTLASINAAALGISGLSAGDVDGAEDDTGSLGIFGFFLSFFLSGGCHAFRMEVLRQHCEDLQGPVVLFLHDCEKLLCGSPERYEAFVSVFGEGVVSVPFADPWAPGLSKKSDVLILGSSTLGDVGAELTGRKAEPTVDPARSGSSAPAGSQPPGASAGNGDGSPLLALDFPAGTLKLNQGPDVRSLLSALFATKIRLDPPRDGPALARWRQLQREDALEEVALGNWARFQGLASSRDVLCPPRSCPVYKQRSMSRMEWSKVLAWAVGLHLNDDASSLLSEQLPPWLALPPSPRDVSRRSLGGADTPASEAKPRDSRLLTLSEAEVWYGMGMLEKAGKGLRPLVQAANVYEQQLISEVLHPDEIGGCMFDGIGALESAKRALREAVQLPLQHPELFERGGLVRPVKGVLLFGPPGTGKTMLARATAAECGASFLSVQMSTVNSKWLGDGVRYIRGIWSLATKLSPTVIFIDEVDALLGRRDSHGEHHSLREMKNEFMTHWDGIRSTASAERVMVLAATNRPQDLDEAALRRFSRRIFCDLPDRDGRLAVLRVLLAEEDMSADVDLTGIAERTDCYSGSDLRNVCTEAAMRPVRELVASMQRPKEAALAATAQEGARERRRSLSGSSLPTTQDAAREGMLVSGSGPRAPGRSQGAASGDRALKLRKLTQADFDAALRQVSSSVNDEGPNMDALREWNSKYGDDGSSASTSRSRSLSYFM